MGYYVSLRNADAVIPAKHLDEAYRRLCKLNERDDLKHGGRVGGGLPPVKWFSWMDPNYPETCPDTPSIFEALGFDIGYTEDNSIEFLGYDSKIGSEEHFCEAVADLFVPGSYLEWRGEDDTYWRWEFDGTSEMKHKSGSVVFDD